MTKSGGVFAATATFCLLVALQPAAAYIGPGAGISAIGAVVGLMAAIVFAVVGFVWYPVKRLRAKRRRERAAGEDAHPSS